MSARTCRCRGECGSHRCLANLTGVPCNARSGTFHLLDGSPVRLERGLCLFCRETRKRSRCNRQKREDRIASGDGQTPSLFA